jgi:hypothetical protein
MTMAIACPPLPAMISDKSWKLSTYSPSML